MSRYRWHETAFIVDVAARRGAVLTGSPTRGWRLTRTVDGGRSDVGWRVDLTPASGEVGPRIVWWSTQVRASGDRCQLRIGRAAETGTSFGDIEGGVLGWTITGIALAVGAISRRRRGGAARPTVVTTGGSADGPHGPLGPGWSVFDPGDVVDAELAPWFNNWPIAWWGPKDERPARVDNVWLNDNRLELTATDWWCSAAAVDQLITLGTELARRLDPHDIGA